MKFIYQTNLLLISGFGLSACVGVGTTIQANCEAQYTEFPAIYQCTHDHIVKKDPSILRDQRAKLYMLRGEQMAQEVKEGKLSSIDAKVRWQKLYIMNWETPGISVWTDSQ